MSSTPSSRRRAASTRSSQAGSAAPTPSRSQRSTNTPQHARQSSTGNGAPSSSPLFYNDSSPIKSTPRAPQRSQAGSQIQSSPKGSSIGRDGQTTPRAVAPLVPLDSSPVQYDASSSPGRSQQLRSDAPSSSSGLFISRDHPSREDRRSDVQSDGLNSTSSRRRRIFVGEDGMPTHNGDPRSETTFSNLNPDTSEADHMGGGSTRVIWGTNISILDVMATWKRFLHEFQPKYRMRADGMSEEEITAAGERAIKKEYVHMLHELRNLGLGGLNLDVQNLKAYPATVKLYHQLQAYPMEIIPLMDQGIKDVSLQLAKEEMQRLRRTATNRQQHRRSSSQPFPSSINSDLIGPRVEDIPDLTTDVELRIYKVLPFNLPSPINLRDLDPSSLDRMISLRGLVIRTTPVIPDMKEAHFRCSVCNHTVMASIDRGKIAEPVICPRQICSSKDSMVIDHNMSIFADKQVIKLQETPDSVPDGQTPHSVSLVAYEELVDVCKAGDRIEVTGIFRGHPVRVNPRQRTVKSLYKTYVDVLHVQKVDKRKVGIDISTVEQELAEHVAGDVEQTRKLSKEELEKIVEISQRPDVYDILSRSLAPSIYELDDVKKGILLQLFGGTNKSFSKGGSPKYRGDINILLCGDPSTSKSQLLQYVHKIAPRGVYTSGKGSSAVGLTAYVTRDPESRQLVLESGALVLSDGGVCCIDEFDKMNDSTRSVLHEVMEQQTVSIAKAGIITTLNARTSILASANPIGSKYNPNLPVPQNIDLPPTLLSRFDLVYLVLDRIEESSDRRLAKHLVGMYLEDTPENASAEEVLPIPLLTAYISHARTSIHPTLSKPAANLLTDNYVQLRSLGNSLHASDRRITATTRQLESMIRLSEAHAKMRLSHTVEESDVEEAVRLIKSAIKASATDARTGLIDMGLLSEGGGASERRRREELKRAILMGLGNNGNEGGVGGDGVRYAELYRQCAEGASAAVEASEFSEAMRGLEIEGRIVVSGEGSRRLVRLSRDGGAVGNGL